MGRLPLPTFMYHFIVNKLEISYGYEQFKTNKSLYRT